jgi:hypothetical protein
MSVSTAGTTSRYTFLQDTAGNLYIPGSELGGKEPIKITHVGNGEIAVEVVTVIMAITGKNRNDAGERWRDYSDDVKRWIQKELIDTNESMYFVIPEFSRNDIFFDFLLF